MTHAWSNFCSSRALCAVSAILPALSGYSAPAVAQTADAGSNAQATALSEVVVTATRRAMSVQEVPLSISVLGNDELNQRGISTLSDFAASVPGVAYLDAGPTGSRGARELILRGISGGDTVGFYIDDTPVPNIDPKLVDIERIEILRGPQSTLYGAGSVGGTFRIITKQPDVSSLESRVEADFSTTDYSDSSLNSAMRASLNAPLVTDKVALRISGWYDHQAGWIDNYIDGDDTAPQDVLRDWNDTDIIGGRAVLAFHPTDRLTITPSAMIQSIDADGSNDVDARLARRFRGRTQVLTNAYEEDYDIYSLVLDYDLNFAKLTSSTSYYKTVLKGIEDVGVALGGIPDGGWADEPMSRIKIRQEAITQEFRLVSESGAISWLDWVAGAYFEDYENFIFFVHDQEFVVPDTSIIFRTDQLSTQKEYAIFGELGFHLTDQLTLTLGSRYFDLDLESGALLSGFFAGGVPDPGVVHPSDVPTPNRSSESGFRPKFDMSYRATDDLMLYATASLGYRPGGAFAPLPEEFCGDSLEDAIGTRESPTGYDSDDLWNYEVGLKSVWADGRVTTNVSVYHMDWKDIQQEGFLSGSCPFSIVLNTGDAESDGFELEGDINLATGLDFTLAVGYVDAKITDPGVFLGAEPGDPLLGVPNWNAHGSLQYTVPAGATRDFVMRADVTYVGERSSVDISDDAPDLPSYTLVNMRLALVSDAWEVTLFGDNLLNEYSPTAFFGGGVDIPGVLTSVQLGNYQTPRTIGVGFKWMF